MSIVQLADQYLLFIDHAQGLKIELAADYLVMASWLAYLKSCLLLPAPEIDEERCKSAFDGAGFALSLATVGKQCEVAAADLMQTTAVGATASCSWR